MIDRHPIPQRARTALAIFLAVTIAGSFAFWRGVEHSRGEIRAAAEEVASHPVNTFTKCLTEGWELSGELPPDWKGTRKWVLE